MKLALIGAGRIGKVHAQAIHSHPGVTLAAVADHHQPAAQALAEQYGSRAVNVDDIFADSSIDAVLIACSLVTYVDELQMS